MRRLPTILAAGLALGATLAPATASMAQAPGRPGAVPARAAEPQPTTHARSAGLRACLPSVTQAAAGSIDTVHTTISSWSQTAPAGHVFHAATGLAYGNAVAPRAVSVLTASPTPTGGCDVSTVQVHPTARSCAAIQQDLTRGGSRVVANLSGTPMLEGAGVRHMLIPAAANSCVIVATGLTFGR